MVLLESKKVALLPTFNRIFLSYTDLEILVVKGIKFLKLSLKTFWIDNHEYFLKYTYKTKILLFSKLLKLL